MNTDEALQHLYATEACVQELLKEARRDRQDAEEGDLGRIISLLQIADHMLETL